MVVVSNAVDREVDRLLHDVSIFVVFEVKVENTASTSLEFISNYTSFLCDHLDEDLENYTIFIVVTNWGLSCQNAQVQWYML